MKSILVPLFTVIAAGSVLAADPLPSWNDTAPKQGIVAFIEKAPKNDNAN